MKRKVNAVLLAICLVASMTITAQNVEVQGKLKVSQMETTQVGESVIVRSQEGELAERPLSSFGSTRNLGTDIELAKALCSCTELPPFLIEGALAAGYSIEDLASAGVTLESLLKGNASISELISLGYTPQELLSSGATPKNLLDGGVDASEIIGLDYGGGLIFYLLMDGSGLVVSKVDQSTGAPWMINNNPISPNATGIGTGLSNTEVVVSVYGNGNYAAKLCFDLDLNGFDDWYLPSKDELNEVYLNVGPPAGNSAGVSDIYWSSSIFDLSSTYIWYQNMSDGIQDNDNLGGYSPTPNVRAIRAFN